MPYIYKNQTLVTGESGPAPDTETYSFAYIYSVFSDVGPVDITAANYPVSVIYTGTDSINADLTLPDSAQGQEVNIHFAYQFTSGMVYQLNYYIIFTVPDTPPPPLPLPGPGPSTCTV